MLIRFACAFAILLPTVGLAAQSKEDACALQGDVVGAIQQARLDRVDQAEVIPTIYAANPDWPDAMKEALPGMVDWVYSMKRRKLRKVELGPVTETQCLENWDALQALSKN